MKHTVRTNKGNEIEIDGYTRGVAIAVYCSECEGFEGNVRDCTATLCPLFPYRKKTYKAVEK